MIINYKSDGEGRLLVIPVVGADDGSFGTKQKALLMFEGYNEIPNDVWPIVYPHIKDKIEREEIELICKEEKDELTKEVVYVQQSINEVRADRARTIVKGCYNEKNLREWNNDPKVSSELRALCDMQLAQIEEGASKTR